jgi:hypothetical protein
MHMTRGSNKSANLSTMDQKIPPNGKGKARDEPQNEESTPSTKPQTEKSMASRVISSASALARDAVGSSNGHVPATLSSISALGGKSQQPSGPSPGPSAWADTVSVRSGAPTNASGVGQPNGIAAESFRTQGNSEMNALAEFDFDKFLSGADSFQLQPDFQGHYPEQPTSWTNDFKSNDDPGQAARTEVGVEVGTIVQSFETDHANFDHLDPYDDGAEVRMLLSDPAFNAFTDTSDMMSATGPSEATVNDLFPQTFSPEEQNAADRIRSALPAPPVHKAVPADHPLNLRPRSDEEKESLQQELQDVETTHNGIVRGQMSFSSDSQREHWVSEWDDVLNSYSDEVWGNMLPAVKAAKDQLEEVRAGATTVDTKAIARLKMILGHVSAEPSFVVSNVPLRNLNEKADEEQDSSLPPFHCPWVSCHQVRQTFLQNKVKPY